MFQSPENENFSSALLLIPGVKNKPKNISPNVNLLNYSFLQMKAFKNFLKHVVKDLNKHGALNMVILIDVYVIEF